MTNTAIVGGDIQGNITSCETKDQLIGVDRTRLIQFSEKETHMVYDVCTRQEISRYTKVGLTGFGLLSMILVAIVFIVCFGIWSDNHY